MLGSETVADDWSAGAPAWERHADAVEAAKAQAMPAMFDRAAVREGDRVLELAAGPGTLGATWCDLVGPSGSVVLSDIAPGMVEVAARRNREHANVRVERIDAAAIDHPSGSFDVVACRMGLMFTPDPGRAFAEILRVLAPGGRFVALTWGALEHNPWMTCVGMAAMMNGVVSGGPPVGPGSVFSLSDRAEVGRLALEAGFADVVVDEVPVVFEADSIDAHVERVGALAGPLALALQRATPDQRTAVHRTAAEIAAPFVTDDGVSIPGRALLISGRRPMA